MRVPFVVVDNNGDEHEISLLFDTVSMTSIDSKTLRKLGVIPDSDAPVTIFTRMDRTGAADDLNETWLGGCEAGSIFVAVCDACATEEVSVARTQCVLSLY